MTKTMIRFAGNPQGLIGDMNPVNFGNPPDIPTDPPVDPPVDPPIDPPEEGELIVNPSTSLRSLYESIGHQPEAPHRWILTQGEHMHFRCENAKRELTEDQRIFIEPHPDHAVAIKPNPVNGSKTFYAGHGGGAGYLTFRGILLRGDDTMIFGTDNPYHPRVPQDDYPGFQLIDCVLDGEYDFYSQTGNRCKWGLLVYGLRDFLMSGCIVRNIFEEHLFYPHNMAGDMRIEDTIFENAGRTALQVANRVSEGDEIHAPPGTGRIDIVRCRVKNVCTQMGGGGSAFSFNGRHRGEVYLTDTEVNMGFDMDLPADRLKNTTGAFVSFLGGGSENINNQYIELDHPRFHVTNEGTGSARREIVKVGGVDLFRMRGGEIVVHRTSTLRTPQPAIAFDPQTIGELDVDASTDVRGDVLWGSKKYSDPDLSGQGWWGFLSDKPWRS